MDFEVEGEIIEWRGPAPHLFVAMSQRDSTELREQPELSYGWGCIRATVTLGETTFATSLMPRQGRYLVPIKARVRRAAGLAVGDVIRLFVHVEDAPVDGRH